MLLVTRPTRATTADIRDGRMSLITTKTEA
jgi:hypothetical protein